MTFDIQKMTESKREARRGLAALPIQEKLQLLDELRERQLDIRKADLRRRFTQMNTDFGNAEFKPKTNST